MLVLVDFRVLEEEGENREGRWSNLNKQHFLLAGSCSVVRSVISRSSVGGRRQGIREVKEIGILIKVLFCANTPNFIQIGGRAYPVRHYPIAIRLCTREEYAILCIALNPQSGDFSDAILEVPSEALLHLRKVLFREKAPEYHSGAINKEKHLRKQMLRTKSAVWFGQTKHA